MFSRKVSFHFIFQKIKKSCVLYCNIYLLCMFFPYISRPVKTYIVCFCVSIFHSRNLHSMFLCFNFFTENSPCMLFIYSVNLWKPTEYVFVVQNSLTKTYIVCFHVHIFLTKKKKFLNFLRNEMKTNLARKHLSNGIIMMELINWSLKEMFLK